MAKVRGIRQQIKPPPASKANGGPSGSKRIVLHRHRPPAAREAPRPPPLFCRKTTRSFPLRVLSFPFLSCCAPPADSTALPAGWTRACPEQKNHSQIPQNHPGRARQTYPPAPGQSRMAARLLQRPRLRPGQPGRRLLRPPLPGGLAEIIHHPQRRCEIQH